MDYEILKWLHILSATLLFGTGLGSAYYKWCADRSGIPEAIAHTNRVVVIADWLFTTPTVIVQPLTGILLVKAMGISLTESWLIATYILYAIAGGCWLPVVWLQIRMRDISMRAVQNGSEPEVVYYRYATLWFWLGMPAFISMIAILFLMVFKPLNII